MQDLFHFFYLLKERIENRPHLNFEGKISMF